jgi:hypothetical protein
MSTKPAHRGPDAHSNRSAGDQLPILTFFNLFAALGCGYLFYTVASSPAPYDKLAALAAALCGGGMTLSAICLAIGLLVRQPWSWRLAVGTQAVAVACQLFWAMLPLYWAATEAEDGLRLFGGLVFDALLMIPLLVFSLVGLFYLMRRNVRALFHAERP